MNWDVIKDWLGIAGVLGGGFVFTVRIVAMLKADKEKLYAEIKDLQDQIDELKQTKADQRIMDINLLGINRAYSELRTELKETHEDIKESMQIINDGIERSDERSGQSMEKMNQQLGILTGTIETLKNFFRK